MTKNSRAVEHQPILTELARILANTSRNNRGASLPISCLIAIHTARGWSVIPLTILFEDLDDAILRGTDVTRLRALNYAVDLLLSGSYNATDVATFGEVIARLADEIELAARAELSTRLAPSDRIPISLAQKLARDDEIQVARPMLANFGRLDDGFLVDIAKSKSQAHLLAISERKTLNTVVTDVLVTRGDKQVVSSVASNEGAKFSDFGFLHLVKRAEGDSILAEHLGLRKDIPRRLFQQLIAKASRDVKKRLLIAAPAPDQQIEESLSGVMAKLHAKFGPASKTFFAAKRIVSAQHRLRHLNETSIADYAAAHKIDEVTVGLSLLCALPCDITERILFDQDREMLLVATKALDFCWNTTMSLLFLGAKDHCITAGDLQALEARFSHRTVKACRTILQHYHARTTERRPDATSGASQALH
jgi:uncharacterized protein (DUF2336 family)